jgi:hypothetical protein
MKKKSMLLFGIMSLELIVPPIPLSQEGMDGEQVQEARK